MKYVIDVETLEKFMKINLPETIAAENGWLEYDVPFWGLKGLFSGAKWLLVSGRLLKS